MRILIVPSELGREVSSSVLLIAHGRVGSSTLLIVAGNGRE
jgi:hypothetical protein